MKGKKVREIQRDLRDKRDLIREEKKKV